MSNMVKYCPICNRSSNEARFIGEICEYCTSDALKKRVPEVVTIYTCRFCSRLKTGSEYNEISGKALAEAMQHELKVADCTFNVKSYDFERRNILIEFICYGGQLVFTKEIRLKIQHQTCPTCYKKHSGYYEAVVQLRGSDEKVQRIMGKLLWYVEKRGAFVTKTEKVRNGYDIYTSSKSITSEFFSYYHLKPIKSYELYGLKSGKKVYRNIYALAVD
ncbi:MAG: NMD3-related protein [Candidatus Micrarchaeia archaeon]